MKQLYSLLLFFLVLTGFSQVTFVIESLPENTPTEDDIYIAGNFSDWNAGHPDFQLEKNSDDKWEIQLAAQADGHSINFKFTRGDWGTVEKDANGNEMPDRQFTFGNGETELIEIANWADITGSNSTAAENVGVMDENFYIPQLERSRRIWIYLPPDYDQSNQTYPVLYMHDGQNLFDSSTAFAGEWEVDETLNYLAEEGKNVPIVVGIDNGGLHRMNEYSTWVNSSYGGGEGDEYVQFIAETLKPFIDENYRTKPEPENTGIMGSSLGGFISHFAIFQYPEVFSKGGLFSPSYWYSDSVWAFSESQGFYNNQKVYQIIGGEEGYSAINLVNEMHDLLLQQGFTSDNIYSNVFPGQAHNEAFWRSEFREAYLWLFSDFASGIKELSHDYPSLVYPNPAQEQIQLKVDRVDSLRVYNLSGETLMDENQLQSNKLNLKSLDSGLYFIQVWSDGKSLTCKFIKL